MGNEAYQLPVLKTVSLSKQPVDEYNLGVESDNPFVDLVPKGGELNVVESCGVSNNGRDDVTELMQQAIDACSMKKATVIVPKGRYSIRPIFLRSNMTLKLEEGAQLLGSRTIQDYRDAFPEAGAIETSALVFGKNIENVKVIGPGLIDQPPGGTVDADSTASVEIDIDLVSCSCRIGIYIDRAGGG